MEPLITVADLEVRWARSLDPTETAQAEAYISDASALVRSIAQDDFVNDDTGQLEVPADIVPVVVSMVRRAIENPRGLTGEQLGDYSWQSNQGGGTTGTIYATRNEKRIIRRAVQLLGVGTVTLQGYFPYAYGNHTEIL